MQASDVVRAVGAAMEVASELDLAAAEARVLRNSNKLSFAVAALRRRCPSGIRRAREFRSSSLRLDDGLPRSKAPWRDLSPEPSRVSTSAMGSRSRFGPTTSRHVRSSHQPTTPRRLSGCMRVWRASMSLCRTSRTESRKLNNSLRPRNEHQGSTTRTGSFSAARYEASYVRSVSAPPPSNCCMESHTQATCSTRTADRCS